MLAEAAERGARDEAVVAMLLYQGLRVSELCGIDVEDLSTQRGHRVVRLRRKGGEEQDQAIAPPAAGCLDAWLAERGGGLPGCGPVGPSLRAGVRRPRGRAADPLPGGVDRRELRPGRRDRQEDQPALAARTPAPRCCWTPACRCATSRSTWGTPTRPPPSGTTSGVNILISRPPMHCPACLRHTEVVIMERRCRHQAAHRRLRVRRGRGRAALRGREERDRAVADAGVAGGAALRGRAAGARRRTGPSSADCGSRSGRECSCRGGGRSSWSSSPSTSVARRAWPSTCAAARHRSRRCWRRGWPRIEVYAADIDAGQLAYAQQQPGALRPPVHRAHEGDLFEALPERLRGSVDLLVVNAPYVPTDAIATLPAEARALRAADELGRRRGRARGASARRRRGVGVARPARALADRDDRGPGRADDGRLRRGGVEGVDSAGPGAGGDRGHRKAGRGVIALVTGANRGLGRETARQLIAA